MAFARALIVLTLCVGTVTSFRSKMSADVLSDAGEGRDKMAPEVAFDRPGAVLARLKQTHNKQNAFNRKVQVEAMQNNRKGQVEGKVQVEETQAQVKVMQFNVFEDGLTDTPGSLGFSDEFDSAFTSLLHGLGGEEFMAFKKVRFPIASLPDLMPIDSTGAFFGALEVLWSAVYQTSGGEARFGATAHSDAPNLGGALRTLFLHTSPPTSTEATWITPRFEAELGKMGGSEDKREYVRGVRANVFNAAHGYLAWDKEMVDGKLWKRDENIWSKWLGNLRILMQQRVNPAEDMAHAVKKALARFIHVYTEDPGEQDMTSLVAVILDDDGSGSVAQIRTGTMQSAVHLMLTEMCKHSLTTSKASDAVKKFLGVAEVPDTAEGRAALIFPSVLQAMDQWMDSATISNRHDVISGVVKGVSPDILTVVEYDEQWQKLGAFGSLAVVHGKGTGAVMFDPAKFTPHANPSWGVQIERFVAAFEGKAPKSSCVVLLERQTDSQLFLVGAVHLESGSPDNPEKVQLRQAQVKATLAQLTTVADALKGAGKDVVVILGGDFNGLAEEFVYGSTPEFWASPGVQKVSPVMTQPNPEKVPDWQAVPPANFASLRERFSLKWRHRTDKRKANGDMVLNEVSNTAGGGGPSCTRAETLHYVIDFIFVGGVTGRQIGSTPLAIASADEITSAASSARGKYNAVMRWGSDHLPVAATLNC